MLSLRQPLTRARLRFDECAQRGGWIVPPLPEMYECRFALQPCRMAESPAQRYANLPAETGAAQRVNDAPAEAIGRLKRSQPAFAGG